MNRIHLLSEQVANQIAAGEVVERPASVVKELVENSLDAGAGRITIEIGAGGRALIRVTDDGSGMSKDDALLCLERHATSKIRKAEDLASIRSMGFRGEAIPSIASVSRFSLTTRERGESSGEATQVIVQGGRISDVKVAAGPHGTTVEVRQLFFNLPARRKFLRTEETERTHILHYVGLAALAYPEVAFTLLSDGRSILQFPAQPWSNELERLPALKERMRQLHGSDAHLLAVDFRADWESSTATLREVDNEAAEGSATEGEEIQIRRDFRVWGFIGAPGVSRSTRDSQHLFVNQRPVENRGLNFALLEGYHTALMKGQYPMCCLFIEIDPAHVDVNIHPQKREVKFRDETLVRKWVSQAIRETLQQFHQTGPSADRSAPTPVARHPSTTTSDFRQSLLPSITPSSSSTTSTIGTRAEKSFQGELMSLETPHPPFQSHSVPPSPVISNTSTGKTHRDLSAKLEGGISPANPVVAPSAATRPLENPSTDSGNQPPRLPPPEVVPLLRVSLRLVGVIGRLYVVFESERGLVLMDQHAAHERVLFEQMLDRLERSDEAPSQKLLLPETVELAPRDADFLRQHLSVLSRLGVEMREFGERTFLLDALPPFIKSFQPRQFIFELIDHLKLAGTHLNSFRLGEDVVAKTVCRHAVKAHDRLAPEELEQLAADLRRCSMPYTCPHGRPTLIEMNWRELEKRFGRVS